MKLNLKIDVDEQQMLRKLSAIGQALGDDKVKKLLRDTVNVVGKDYRNRLGRYRETGRLQKSVRSKTEMAGDTAHAWVNATRTHTARWLEFGTQDRWRGGNNRTIRKSGGQFNPLGYSGRVVAMGPLDDSITVKEDDARDHFIREYIRLVTQAAKKKG